MKIESIIRRDGGSEVTIGDMTYHFAPQPDGRHIAEVADEEHVDRLVGITDGFRIARDLKASTAIPNTAIPNTAIPKAAAPVKPSVPETARTAENPAGGEQQTGEGSPAGAGEAGTGTEQSQQTGGATSEGGGQSGASGEDDLEELDRDVLIAKYTEVFGSAPPLGVKKKSLISALRERANG